VIVVRNVVKCCLVGAASFSLALLITTLMARRSGQSDPRERVDRLISRCESKISEIEGSLGLIQSAVESPA
jgi:hypothetical protein